jgi:hypothetical protein
MKNLIDIALEEAARRANSKIVEVETNQRQSGSLYRRLAILKKGAMSQVGTLDLQACAYGTLIVEPGSKPTQLMKVQCKKDPNSILQVMTLHGDVFRCLDQEEPKIWAMVMAPRGLITRIATREMDGIVALEPFLEDLGKALAVWFIDPKS